MGVIILFNVILMALETNKSAECVTDDLDEAECENMVVTAFNTTLLVIYTVEVMLRLYVRHLSFFSSAYNWNDLFIVVVGWADLLVTRVAGGADLPNIQMFRMFRILRLVRAVRVLKIFPELYQMLQGFASAMKAMFWGVTMIFILLFVWSILAVQIIHPRNVELVGGSDGASDTWCASAFSSVELSMLLFFQTIVAGDSWGACAVPLIRNYPITALIFAGALTSVQLGFMNLILSVVVDAAAAAREADVENRAKEFQKQKAQGTRELHSIMERIDADGSGEISLEELLQGYDTEPEMRYIFHSLDIDRKDLGNLFSLMDSDFTGTLPYNDFVDMMQKAVGQDVRMQLMSLKMQLGQVSSQIHEVKASMEGKPRPRRPANTSSKEGMYAAPNTIVDVSLPTNGCDADVADTTSVPTVGVAVNRELPGKRQLPTVSSALCFSIIDREVQNFRRDLDDQLRQLAEQTAMAVDQKFSTLSAPAEAEARLKARRVSPVQPNTVSNDDTSIGNVAASNTDSSRPARSPDDRGAKAGGAQAPAIIAQPAEREQFRI